MTMRLSRILPSTVDATVNMSTWTIPPLFEFLVQQGNIPRDERFSAFNMGVGLIAMVSPEDADAALSRTGEGWRIGELVEGSGQVRLV